MRIHSLALLRAAGLSACAAFAIPAAANAADSGLVVQTVSTAGLDLTTPEGQHAMRHRIDLASHKICRDVLGTDDANSPGYAECYLEARNGAVGDLTLMVAQAKSTRAFATNAPK